jgi:RNA polymerase sigma-70 factor (ECF subfamily)
VSERSPADDQALEGYRPYLRLLARLQLGARWQAKVDPSDLVQQTLLEAHRSLAQYCGSGGGHLAAWLRGILAHQLIHTVRDLRREKRDADREVSLEQSLEDSSDRLGSWLAADQSSPSERAEREEQAVRVAAALEQLPEAQREAVVLHYWHGWTLPEIGRHLGRSESAAAGLVQRGLKGLRLIMKREG